VPTVTFQLEPGLSQEARQRFESGRSWAVLGIGSGFFEIESYQGPEEVATLQLAIFPQRG